MTVRVENVTVGTDGDLGGEAFVAMEKESGTG